MVNFRDLKHFQDHQYTRHLVLRTNNVEIIVVCWRPGQGSPIHGHGPSDAIEVILEGTLSYTNYYPDGRTVSGILQAGDISHTPVGVKHQIANNANEELVTLHIYSPPLNPEFQGFDLGYANDVAFEEIQLPDEVIRFIRAASPMASVDTNYVI